MKGRRGGNRRGQATTEVVLLLPLFMLFLLAFAKVFALLILMQKLEIASFYAARRWQLESHRNAQHEGWDGAGGAGGGCGGTLCSDIQDKVKSYIGYGNKPVADFLGLVDNCPPTKDCKEENPGVMVKRTQVWNLVTVTACVKIVETAFVKAQNLTVCSTKYVPNRDRPIAFILPGVKQ